MTPTFKVGDRVTFPPDANIKASLVGVTFRVETVPTGRKRKYGIRAESGGPIYGVTPEQLIPASDDAPSIGRPFVPREFFCAGEIVTVTSSSGKIAKDQPMVVLKDSGRDNVNITPLGGDGDRYWRWPARGLVKRDLAWLAEQLLEKATA